MSLAIPIETSARHIHLCEEDFQMCIRDRAGSKGPRTGVTVKSRHAGCFPRSPVDPSGQKSQPVSICQSRKSNLDPQPQSFFPLTQFQYTPDRY